VCSYINGWLFIADKCPELLCDVHCEYGHVLDENGCPTCTCHNNPCDVSLPFSDYLYRDGPFKISGKLVVQPLA